MRGWMRILFAAACLGAALLAVGAATLGRGARDATRGEGRAAPADGPPERGERRAAPAVIGAAGPSAEPGGRRVDADARGEATARGARASSPRGPGETLGGRIAAAALAQIGVTLRYDPAYVRLPYPGGDVPAERGVCSDVVVRALRAVGIDLQRELHEDMRAHFALYPRRWGLTAPDRNIDHRRVPNLMTWFARQGWTLPDADDAAAYADGDIVAWDLGRGLTHIGVVSVAEGRPLIVHNIGQGARREDVLFAWRRIGNYRVRGR